MMGMTTLYFTFNGSKEEFLGRTNDWLTLTTEGKRYRIKSTKNYTILKIKRGLGFFTAPIIMEFNISSQMENSLKMFVNGYVVNMLFIIPLGKLSLVPSVSSISSFFGGLPRTNGWKDMVKLLEYIGVDENTIHP